MLSLCSPLHPPVISPISLHWRAALHHCHKNASMNVHLYGRKCPWSLSRFLHDSPIASPRSNALRSTDPNSSLLSISSMGRNFKNLQKGWPFPSLPLLKKTLYQREGEERSQDIISGGLCRHSLANVEWDLAITVGWEKAFVAALKVQEEFPSPEIQPRSHSIFTQQ